MATVPIGKLRLRYAVESESRSGHVALGLANVIEVRTDRSVVLDEASIPPLLFCGASGLLNGFVAQLRACCIIAPKRSPAASRNSATRGAAEIADYLLLQVCNRYEPLITHLAASAGQVHPETLYRVSLSLAGELATFTESRKRPPVSRPIAMTISTPRSVR